MPKNTTDISEIEDIKGVGSSLAERIKDTLDIGSVEELAAFSEDELTRVKGIGSDKAKSISEQLETLLTKCERCGEEYLSKENCPKCTKELEEKLKDLREKLESQEVEEDIEKAVNEIESHLDEGNIEQGFDILEKTEDELSKIEEEKEVKKISDIDGVGPTYVKRIKSTLDVESIEELAKFGKEDLKKVKGIGEGRAKNISDQLDNFRKICQRCSQIYFDEEVCPHCTEELREELELVKKNLKSLKQDVDPEGRWELDKKIDDIESKLSIGEFEQTTELLDFIKDELAAAEQLYTVLIDIETRLKDENELINNHTYLEARDSMIKSLRRGNYHRAGLKAKKIKEHIEKEKKYHKMDESELKRLNIEEFSSEMMGLGKREGENIYKEGFHTLEDVYKAGKQGLMESGIDEKTSDRLMKILDPMFQDMEIDMDIVEGRDEEKTLESKEDIVFRETEKETEEEKEPEEEQIDREEEEIEYEEPSKPEEKKIEDEVEETPDTSDIFGEDLTEDEMALVEEEEVEFKYWLPAILVPIVLAISAYLLFFM